MSKNPKTFVGQTLGDLVKNTGFNFYGWVVFLLRDKDDSTGARVAEDFRISQIVRKHPELTGCIVKCANDYYGQTVLRVIDPKTAAESG